MDRTTITCVFIHVVRFGMTLGLTRPRKPPARLHGPGDAATRLVLLRLISTPTISWKSDRCFPALLGDVEASLCCRRRVCTSRFQTNTARGDHGSERLSLLALVWQTAPLDYKRVSRPAQNLSIFTVPGSFSDGDEFDLFGLVGPARGKRCLRVRSVVNMIMKSGSWTGGSIVSVVRVAILFIAATFEGGNSVF